MSDEPDNTGPGHGYPPAIEAAQSSPSSQAKRHRRRKAKWETRYAHLAPTRQAKIALLNETILDEFTPDKAREVVNALIKKAVKGDVFAANTLFDRTVGKASQKITIENDTEEQDQRVTHILHSPELARLANDFARCLAMQSGGTGVPPEPGCVDVAASPRFIESKVSGSGDGAYQAVNDLNAAAAREITNDLSVVPAVVSGEFPKESDHSGELRIGICGELGPQSKESGDGAPEGSGRKAV